MISENALYIAGLVVLIVVGLYFLFQAVDTLGLEARKDAGTVAGKEYREAKRGYRTEIINNQPRQVPHTTPERYVLKLEIGGGKAEGIVARSLYDELQAGDRVQVTFRKRRLSGFLQVVEVTR